MSDTNQSLTRSRAPWVNPQWAATLQPSKKYKYLLLVCAFAVARALTLIDIAAYWLLPLAAVCSIVLFRLFCSNKLLYLLTHQSNGCWTLSPVSEQPDNRFLHGKTLNIQDAVLCQSGYRSANLIILVFARINEHSDKQVDCSNGLVRIPIWRDSVTPSDFSYLHLQLAYSATPLPNLKQRMLSSLRYTSSQALKTGLDNETTDLSRR